MNNTAISIYKAKNCMPYIQSIRPLVIIERIIKITKDKIAVIPMAISENKYLLKILADCFTGKVP